MKHLLLPCALLIALPAFAQDPATGFPPFGSFANGRFDAVNRANLNVHFAIPIVSVPGRGLGLSHAITYDSLVWKRSGNTWAPVSTSSWGWNLSLIIGSTQWKYHTGQCYGIDGEPEGITKTYDSYFYTDPNGTRHDFPSVNAVWSGCDAAWDGEYTGGASDGSGYTIEITPGFPPAWAVYAASGLKITDKLSDTNGNYISSTTASNVTTWKDTLGRDALKIDSSVPNTVTYKYLDNQGNYQTITVALQTFTNIQTNFQCSGVVEYTGSATLPVSVTFPGTPNNVTYTFTYEDTPGLSGKKSGRLKRVTLPTGGYYEYTYPTTGNKGISCADGTHTSLTRVINDGTSATWTFTRTYVSPNFKTTVTPPTANKSTYTFNTSGQLISEKHYQGAELDQNLKRTINTSWAPNKTPASTTVILEDNSTQSKTETDFSSIGLLLESREYAFGAGAPGGLVRRTTNTYGYFARPTRVEVHDGAGNLKARTDVAYDGAALTDCSATAPQHESSYDCSFTARGNPTTVTTYPDAATAPSGGIARNSTYDIFGNVRTADVNCCQQKEWLYSPDYAYAYPTTIKSGSSGSQLTTLVTYNSYTGLPSDTTDPNGLVVRFGYDTLKRATSVTVVNSPNDVVTSYVYDDSARTVLAKTPIQGTDQAWRTTYFDTLGRPNKTQVSDSSGANCSETKVQYDNLSRPYRQANPATCGGASQYWTQVSFDALGRPTATNLVDANAGYAIVSGHTTTYSYSGATVTVTDPAGKARKTEGDALGRLIRVYEPDVNNPSQLTVTTDYTYNLLDLLTNVTQGVQARTYQYDDMGRLTQQATPEGGTWQFQYNAFNQITQRTDARGVITNYSYDSLNHLTQVSYDVGSTGVQTTATVTYAYGAPNDTDPNKRGRLLTVTDGPGSESYTYDNLGRTAQVQKIIGSATYTTSYGYNLAGEMTSTTYPSGRVVQQSFDSIGRLTGVQGTLNSVNTQYLSSFTYDQASSLVTGFNYGNGVTTSFGYSSERLQLTSLTYTKDSNTLFSLNYWYKNDATNCTMGNTGNNGQIQCITDNVDNGRSVAYTYDALYRLKTAETVGSTNYPKWGLQWTYDRYGNRTNQTVTAGSGPPSSLAISQTTNRIIDDGYAYDANGNLTVEPMTPLPPNNYAYDAQNNLVSLNTVYDAPTKTLLGTFYQYDGSGRRVSKQEVWKCGGGYGISRSSTIYVFSGTRVLFESIFNVPCVGRGSVFSKEYVYAGSQLVAVHDNAFTSTLQYVHTDHLSTRLITDTSGGTIEQKGHFAFGEAWYEATGGSKWKFTTYERDAESDNDYAMARYHLNRLGRFSSPDPISGSVANPQSLNRYSYVADDPVNLMDPTGLVLEGGDGPGDCYPAYACNRHYYERYEVFSYFRQLDIWQAAVAAQASASGLGLFYYFQVGIVTTSIGGIPQGGEISVWATATVFTIPIPAPEPPLIVSPPPSAPSGGPGGDRGRSRELPKIGPAPPPLPSRPPGNYGQYLLCVGQGYLEGVSDWDNVVASVVVNVAPVFFASRGQVVRASLALGAAAVYDASKALALRQQCTYEVYGRGAPVDRGPGGG